MRSRRKRERGEGGMGLIVGGGAEDEVEKHGSRRRGWRLLISSEKEEDKDELIRTIEKKFFEEKDKTNI